MKARFDEIGYPLYCDAGPHEGDTRIDLTIRLYLSPQEYARYQGPESLRITLGEPGEADGAAETFTGRPAGDNGRPARPVPGPAEPMPAPTAKGAHRWLSLNPLTTRPPATGSTATPSSP